MSVSQTFVVRCIEWAVFIYTSVCVCVCVCVCVYICIYIYIYIYVCMTAVITAGYVARSTRSPSFTP